MHVGPIAVHADIAVDLLVDNGRQYIDILGMSAAKPNPRHGVGLDLPILAVLGREPAHGYAILNSLRLTSNGVFDLP